MGAAADQRGSHDFGQWLLHLSRARVGAVFSATREHDLAVYNGNMIWNCAWVGFVDVFGCVCFQTTIELCLLADHQSQHSMDANISTSAPLPSFLALLLYRSARWLWFYAGGGVERCRSTATLVYHGTVLHQPVSRTARFYTNICVQGSFFVRTTVCMHMVLGSIHQRRFPAHVGGRVCVQTPIHVTGCVCVQTLC